MPAKPQLTRQLTQRLDAARREFVRLGETWLVQPDQVELLHDLRVASRRMRAVLDLLRREPALAPASTAAKAAMAPLVRLSSPLRDLDVLLPEAQLWCLQLPELAPLPDVIAMRRAEAAAQFARQWQQQQASVAQALDVLQAQLQAVDLAPAFRDKELARCEKRVRRALHQCADHADAAAWHRLRIRCKQWRYTLELFAVKAVQVKRLQRLQKCLGEAQDAAAAIAQLAQLASSSMPPSCILAMGRRQQLLEQQQTRMFKRARRLLQQLLAA